MSICKHVALTRETCTKLPSMAKSLPVTRNHMRQIPQAPKTKNDMVNLLASFGNAMRMDLPNLPSLQGRGKGVHTTCSLELRAPLC